MIGGVTGSLHRPAALLLGRYASDTGRLHYAGRTTSHLTDIQAAATAPLLVAAIGGHPWPAQLTVNWRSKPTCYHQVARWSSWRSAPTSPPTRAAGGGTPSECCGSGTSPRTRCRSTWI
ncbi:hypothetical protein [Actinopolymorpha pittospori]|uniref:hypothetical protein n=1 Tax=Actinopolymorpha pittospori TaxID=648752 RepID=UPI00178ACE89|nr:hypothetical protein [Actinopolymorpha pittospori]